MNLKQGMSVLYPQGIYSRWRDLSLVSALGADQCMMKGRRYRSPTRVYVVLGINRYGLITTPEINKSHEKTRKANIFSELPVSQPASINRGPIMAYNKCDERLPSPPVLPAPPDESTPSPFPSCCSLRRTSSISNSPSIGPVPPNP